MDHSIWPVMKLPGRMLISLQKPDGTEEHSEKGDDVEDYSHSAPTRWKFRLTTWV
jgi:hypothetical protein